MCSDGLKYCYKHAPWVPPVGVCFWNVPNVPTGYGPGNIGNIEMFPWGQVLILKCSQSSHGVLRWEHLEVIRSSEAPPLPDGKFYEMYPCVWHWQHWELTRRSEAPLWIPFWNDPKIPVGYGARNIGNMCEYERSLKKGLGNMGRKVLEYIWNMGKVAWEH